MNKFKTAAIEILSQAKKPLHIKDITRLAIESGILETDGATPEQSMNANISVDIKTKGKASDFIRVNPSVYKINLKKTVIKDLSRVIEEEKQEDEKVIIDSSFTGKAGEHLVCSELLFREYNASIMSVDVGMDIAATKNEKLFSIQVKTANLNKYNTYNFDVRKVSFERHKSGNVFYVFVLRGQESKFLVLPYYEMERKVEEQAIKEVDGKRKFRVTISIRDEKIYLGNRNHEMSYFLNKWDIIK
jgi:hypothetical protein